MLIFCCRNLGESYTLQKISPIILKFDTSKKWKIISLFLKWHMHINFRLFSITFRFIFFHSRAIFCHFTPDFWPFCVFRLHTLWLFYIFCPSDNFSNSKLKFETSKDCKIISLALYGVVPNIQMVKDSKVRKLDYIHTILAL